MTQIIEIMNVSKKRGVCRNNIASSRVALRRLQQKPSVNVDRQVHTPFSQQSAHLVCGIGRRSTINTLSAAGFKKFEIADIFFRAGDKVSHSATKMMITSSHVCMLSRSCPVCVCDVYVQSIHNIYQLEELRKLIVHVSFFSHD